MLIVVLLVLFVLCNFADDVSDRFERANIYVHCDWYKFPGEVQHLLPIIIINTQKSVVVKGFGNIDCTREQFKMVIHSIFHKILKKFTNEFIFERITGQINFIGCAWCLVVLYDDALIFKVNEKTLQLLTESNSKRKF